MLVTTPKLCKHCAHSTRIIEWVCRMHVDVVDGDAMACCIVRGDNTLCGPKGVWFIDRDAHQPDNIETPKAT